LRLEKGYRYYGAELTTGETPDEAGLGAFVRPAKGDFIGRAAVLGAREAAPGGPASRLRTVVIGGSDWLPVYGGEAVRIDGRVVGRLRSAAFGYTVERTIGTVYLPAGVAEGTAIEVDLFGGREPGSVAPDVLVDPTGARMRA
jgi:glycine cleavage system aminomethyltransferase T